MIIASVSGGLSSAEMLRRVIERYGRENVIAVFADVKGDARSHRRFSPFPLIDELLHERFGGEAPDLYRFLWQLSYALDIPIVRLEQYNTIFAHQARAKAFMIRNGNGVNFAPCSLYGKRELIAGWINKTFFMKDRPILALGFDWAEAARLKNARHWWSGIVADVVAPLVEKPYLDNMALMQWCESLGIDIPSAYILDFQHNNCYGGCVEAGIAQFILLRKVRPGVFYYWMWMEQIIQEYIGTESTILRDSRGGEVNPLSLRKLDEMLKNSTAPKRWESMADQKGCSCMATPLFDMSTIPLQVKTKTHRTITPCP